MPGYAYTGASGRLYSYLLFSTDDLGTLPKQGGIYIFALNDSGRTPVFIEATNSVRASVARQAMAEWKTAVEVHGAKLVLIHVAHDRTTADWQSEKTDLIAVYYPPMNPNPDGD